MGDPACWVDEVCPECGRFVGGLDGERCPRCGHRVHGEAEADDR